MFGSGWSSGISTKAAATPLFLGLGDKTCLSCLRICWITCQVVLFCKYERSNDTEDRNDPSSMKAFVTAFRTYKGTARWQLNGKGEVWGLMLEACESLVVVQVRVQAQRPGRHARRKQVQVWCFSVGPNWTLWVNSAPFGVSVLDLASQDVPTTGQ